MAKTAKKNYKMHSGDYTSRPDYYASLDYVERNYKYGYYDENGMWVPNKGLDPNDAGLTDCLNVQRRMSWEAEVAANTINGKTKVNVGTSNSDAFDQFVVQKGDLGVPGDYNFGRLGDVDRDVYVQRASSNGVNVVNQFEGDTGIPKTKNKRIFQYSYEVERKNVSMHTGKEAGSNNQRLPGGYLPDDSTEVVIDATTVDKVGGASTIEVSIMDDTGKKLFPISLNGKVYKTMQDLRDLKANYPKIYKRIIGK